MILHSNGAIKPSTSSWVDLLRANGVDDSYLTGEKCPCPKCGGTDRFKFDTQTGDGFCNQCRKVAEKDRNGVSTLAWAKGISVRDAKKIVKEWEATHGPLAGSDQQHLTVDRSEQSQQIIDNSVLAYEAEPVRLYLTNRGIDPDILETLDDVRYLDEAYCPPIFGADEEGRSSYGCLVSIYRDEAGEVQALQLTAISGGSKARKDARRFLGEVKGSSVNLGRDVFETIVLCEGLETGLAVLQLLDDDGYKFQVRVSGSANNLDSVPVPDGTTCVIIAADNDEAGLKAARDAADGIRCELRIPVKIAVPEPIKKVEAVLVDLYASLLAHVESVQGKNKAERGHKLADDVVFFEQVAKLDEVEQEKLRGYLENLGLIKSKLFGQLVDKAKQANTVEKYDWADALLDGGNGLGRKIADAERYLPSILDSTELEDNVQHLIQAMGCEPTIYQRDSVLVEPKVTFGGTGEKRTTLVPMNFDSFLTQTTRIVRWTKMNAKTGEIVDTYPNQHVVKSVLHQSVYPTDQIRIVRSVSEVPILSQGRLITRPGVDESGILIAPIDDSFKGVTLPEKPTLEDAKLALNEVLDLFADFPLKDVDRSVVFALLMTIVKQYCYDGSKPLFQFDANLHGAGKTLGLDLCCRITLGRSPGMSGIDPNDDNETRKAITSLLMGGSRVIVYDNVRGRIELPSLERFVTSQVWTDRILGQNKTVSLAVNQVVCLSSNNAELSPDLQRRTLQARLEVDVANPTDRNGFRIPDIRQYVQDRRAYYYQKLLLIARAYEVAGCPVLDPNFFNSFEAWDRAVRQLCMWVGAGDPLLSREQLKMPEERDGLVVQLLLFIHAKKGERPFQTTEIMTWYTSTISDTAEIKTILNGLYTGSHKPSPIGLGRLFGNYKGRPMPTGDGRLIRVIVTSDPDSEHKGSKDWAVRLTAGESIPQNRGIPQAIPQEVKSLPANDLTSAVGELGNHSLPSRIEEKSTDICVFYSTRGGSESENSPMIPQTEVNSLPSKDLTFVGESEKGSGAFRIPQIPSSINELRSILAAIPSGQVGFDIETTGLVPTADTLVSYQIGTCEQTIIVPIGHTVNGHLNLDRDEALASLSELLTRSDVTVLVYNWSFEGTFLKSIGVDLPVFHDEARTQPKVVDVMVVRHLSYPYLGKRGQFLGLALKDTCREFLNLDMEDIENVPGATREEVTFVGRKKKTKKVNQVVDFSGTDPLNPEVQRYQSLDVEVLFRLLDLFSGKYDHGTLCIETATRDALFSTSQVTIDHDVAKDTYDELEGKKTPLQDEFNLLTGGNVNLASFKQLKKYFEGRGVKLPLSKKSKTPTTGEEFIEAYRHDPTYGKHVQIIERYRSLSKLQEFAQQALASGKRVVAYINPLGTSTGRFSSSAIKDIPGYLRSSIQQLPVEARKFYRAPEGYKIVNIDYAQIELRLAANLSKEPKFFDMLAQDPHRTAASKIFKVPYHEVTKEQRKLGKALNFRALYFGTPEIEGKTKKECRELARLWLEEMAVYKTFVESESDKAYESWQSYLRNVGPCGRGPVTVTAYGRSVYDPMRLIPAYSDYYHRPEKFDKDMAASEILRKISNNLMQSVGADLNKRGLCNAVDLIRSDYSESVRLLTNVHDSIVLEVRDDQHLVETCKRIADAYACKTGFYRTPADWAMPIETGIEIGENWGELMSLEEYVERFTT